MSESSAQPAVACFRMVSLSMCTGRNASINILSVQTSSERIKGHSIFYTYATNKCDRYATWSVGGKRGHVKSECLCDDKDQERKRFFSAEDCLSYVQNALSRAKTKCHLARTQIFIGKSPAILWQRCLHKPQMFPARLKETVQNKVSSNGIPIWEKSLLVRQISGEWLLETSYTLPTTP